MTLALVAAEQRGRDAKASQGVAIRSGVLMSVTHSSVAGAAERNEMLLAAREAGLRYVDPADPGIQRVKLGEGFAYLDRNDNAIADESTLARIRSIVIPPAWTDVWISPTANGHIQAVGRDARGRLQYRYHKEWRQVRDATKYERTIAFARALPKLRRAVARDLRARGLPREKVIAAAVRLMDMTLIRVGNEEYARENKSFGLTTLRRRHARVRGDRLQLTFRGKSGKEHSVGLRDKRLARIVKACQELPGQHLLQYVDEDGQVQRIDSDDVNEYLRTHMGADFSAKDFRTWAGTVLAARAFTALGDEAATPSSLKRAIEDVAQKLGNTPTVCRNCYIHPEIIDSYLDGSLAELLAARANEKLEKGRGLRADERFVLSVLRSRLKAENRRAARKAA
jgi:DNA topoisomerase I